MKIVFNPSTVAALTSPPDNKDITFDLSGHNIFARGVKFQGTDTNTWRDIKINNVSIGSNVLDLRNGSNTTLTNTNGVVTINSTWRPVVDNLTSNSTTSSLSANQGRVLAGLINSKSDSDHNHDDRYLRLTGGWMSGDINFGGDNKIYWGRNTDSASISFKNDGDGDADSYMSFVISDNSNEYFRWSHSYGSTNTEWMALRSDGLRVRGTKVSLEGHSHNDLYYTKAESNAKYITDITTSVNKLTFTKNESNIAKDITVNVVYSQGYLTNIPNNDATTKASPGLRIYNSYAQTIGTNRYSSVLSINTGGTIQIAGNWGDDTARNLYWRSQSDRPVTSYPWKPWRTILDSENYSSTLDSRYYTESEVNSLLDAKLNRQNLSYGTWNPRGYNLAADYCYNGGDLSISENSGKIFVSIGGSFWQNEGKYRVLDTSDVASLKGDLTVHQHLSATDNTWYPLIWGGSSHANTNDSTGAVYKSHDKLSWQTSSQTLYTTRLQTTDIIFSNSGTYMRGIQGTVGDNDFQRIKGGATASDTGFKWISDGVCQIYANNVAIGQWTSGGMDWFKNPTVNGNKVWNAGNDGSGSGLDADTVDGYHASHLLVKRGRLGAYNIDKETTFGTRDIQPESEVTISGKRPFNGWGTLLVIGSIDGASNHQLAFTGDNRMFIRCAYGTSNNYNTKDWATVALTSDNVASATKLAAARTIWGQSFDGTGNVDGTLRIRQTTSNYCEGIRIQTADSTWATIVLGATADSGTNTNAWSIHRKADNNFSISRNSSDGLNGLVMTSVGMGLGTTSPSYRLHVVGDIYSSATIRTAGQMRASGFHHESMNSDNYMLLAGGGYKSFGGDDSNLIFLGYLDLNHGNDGTISSSFSCLGYSVPFTYTRGGNYCRIYIPDTIHQVFYIKAAIASVNYSGGGMNTWVGVHRGAGAWWLHCYASGTNEVSVKGFRQDNNNNDSWWGGNPLWSGNDGANKITVCIFGYVKFR